jgi:hypothetical protein
LSPRAYTDPLLSVAMQIARPPATPDVALPGFGTSLNGMHGTYLTTDLYFAASSADPLVNYLKAERRIYIMSVTLRQNQLKYFVVYTYRGLKWGSGKCGNRGD